MSFVNKIRSSQAKDIYLINGQVGSKNCWYYAHLNKMAYERFKIESKENSKPINVEKYGRILKSGWGNNPAKYIQDKVDREGLNYNDREFEVEPDQVDLCYYVKAPDNTGRWAYYYMEIPAAKCKEFTICAKYGGCNISDYGKIINSGYGEPPESLKQEMRAYGFVHPEDKVDAAETTKLDA